MVALASRPFYAEVRASRKRRTRRTEAYQQRAKVPVRGTQRAAEGRVQVQRLRWR